MSTAAKPQKSNRNTDNDDVPAKLLKTAIRLYAEHGCHAVSARQIIKEAGVLNDAAIRYYFGNKKDLLRACVKDVAANINPVMQQVFNQLQARKADTTKPPITARHVVTALFQGFILLHHKNTASLTFIARMLREEGVEGQRMQVEELGEVQWRFEDELTAVLPDKSAKAIRLHTVLGVTTMINGLVDQALFSTLPAKASGRQEYPLSIDELGQGFVDFLTLGIAGTATI
jgi:AcrR family transcriptional regulator